LEERAGIELVVGREKSYEFVDLEVVRGKEATDEIEALREWERECLWWCFKDMDGGNGLPNLNDSKRSCAVRSSFALSTVCIILFCGYRKKERIDLTRRGLENERTGP
jgi:hypothetical protein